MQSEFFRFHFTLGMNKWVLQEEIKLSRTKVFGAVSTAPQLRYLTITPFFWTIGSTTVCLNNHWEKLQNCEYPSYSEFLPSPPLNRLHTYHRMCVVMYVFLTIVFTVKDKCRGDSMKLFYSAYCNRDNVINEEHLKEKKGGLGSHKRKQTRESSPVLWESWGMMARSHTWVTEKGWS